MKTKNILFVLLIFPGFVFRAGGQQVESWKAPSAVVERLTKNQPQFNYIEEKVPLYTLPDPLVDQQGKKISSMRKWTSQKRQEVLELFRENVYGRVPQTPYEKEFIIVNQDNTAMGGKAVLKEVDIKVSSGAKSLVIRLTLFLPKNTDGPSPVFLLIDNRGPSNTDPSRKVKSEFWPAEEVIARNYGIAVFYNSDVDPDNYDEFKNGIHGILDVQPRQPDSWGTLAAWAWGASRCMDYFETDAGIDSKHVAVLGHSRGGKTALWAGAEDERFSIVISNESGCGGAAIARRKYGETIARINTSFPHWFCLNYRNFSGNEEAMPVDMHQLLGLIAPRGLYVACADEDLWGDPKGSYIALQNALPVFNLLGTDSSVPQTMPPLNTPVGKGMTGFHIRDGGHNLILKDWNWFMDFADRVWER